ncbi:ras association domain-containing protein 3 isoform X1 [Acinonyx jubatus]|uniref:Ras association domain-containing protein 3 isoform X1 n=1 Tax=Acinonyx jubatus TaxID=32536 RepID=A0ABM3QET5_ACIJB|nr:ras association domain-containing protein 3 isoform X1 [Acinonyx jubatus]
MQSCRCGLCDQIESVEKEPPPPCPPNIELVPALYSRVSGRLKNAVRSRGGRSRHRKQQTVEVCADVEKEKETHNYLSKEEIKEKVHKYNLAVTDKLKMTLNSNGIYTGFIKVQMELCRPPQTSPSLGKLAPSSNGCTNTLHISSTNTVGEVIEALLKKFLVTESPAKFALYKRCHREDQVYACKLSDREHPLYLRLVAGPRTDTLSFVLREHEIGEWEAFSLPELQNFLRILDKEEDEQLQSLKRRYAAYRHKLEEALSEVWKPD